MGYVIRCKGNQEKANYCSRLRTMGISHRPTPFRTKGDSMNTICVFKDHFYTAHWEQIEGIMEGESMIEITFNEYEKQKRKSGIGL